MRARYLVLVPSRLYASQLLQILWVYNITTSWHELFYEAMMYDSEKGKL